MFFPTVQQCALTQFDIYFCMCGVWGWATLETVPWEIQSTLRDKNMGEAWSQTTFEPKSLRRRRGGLHSSIASSEDYELARSSGGGMTTRLFRPWLQLLSKKAHVTCITFFFFCLLTGQHYSFKTYYLPSTSPTGATVLLGNVTNKHYYLKDLPFFQLQKSIMWWHPLNFFLHRIHSNVQDGKRGGGAFSFLFLTLGGKLGNPTLVLHSSSGGTYLDWSSCSQFAYLEREVENIEYFSLQRKEVTENWDK